MSELIDNIISLFFSEIFANERYNDIILRKYLDFPYKNMQ